MVLLTLGAATGAIVAAPILLSAAGFTAGGIAAGSIAATIQSGIGNVAAGKHVLFMFFRYRSATSIYDSFKNNTT